MSETVKWLADGVRGSNAEGRITHIRRAYVDSSTALDSVTVLSVAGIPAMGDEHPSEPLAKVVDLRSNPLGNGYEWTVDVEYAFEEPPPDDPEGTWTLRVRRRDSATQYADDPRDEPWEIDQDAQEIDLVPPLLAEAPSPGGTPGEDADPNVNTAGEEFAQPITIPVTCPVLTLEKNQTLTANSPSNASNYVGSTNSAEITVAGITIPVRCGLIRKCGVRKRYYWDTAGTLTGYWRFRMEIIVFPSSITTDIRVAQRGYNQKVDGATVPVYAADGTPVRTPVHLGASGAKSEDPFYRYFVRPRVLAWSGLTLPTSV